MGGLVWIHFFVYAYLFPLLKYDLQLHKRTVYNQGTYGYLNQVKN